LILSFIAIILSIIESQVLLLLLALTLPHNRTLWSEVERDFRGLETILTDFAA